MKVTVVSGDITQQTVGAIVVNLFEGVTVPGGATGAVDGALSGAISRLIEEGEIRGKQGELTLIHTLGMMTPSRVLVVGLGRQSKFDVETVRTVSAQACRHLRRIGIDKVATIAHGSGVGGIDARASGQAIAEGSVLGLYKFDKYKSDGNDSRDVKELVIVESDKNKVKAMKDGVSEGQLLAQSVNLCRDMANEPANYMTPTRMAETALDVAREGDLEIEVLDRPDMARLEMGAFLGVAQGSDEAPKLIVLRYKGDAEDESNSLGLVGKGITFDSGGISIKPASNMGAMKGDMAGGASVIAAMKAIAVLKPKINVTAIVPATENMPGDGHSAPGTS